MIRSETLDALSVALSAAQGEFEAVSKTANNPFFKSKYAALPDVVKAAAPILAQHGLAVWQGGDTDETGELLWTVVLHKSGQFVGSAARLLPIKGDPQAQGSAITYQRRYQYMSALGLVADDDDDGNAASRSKPSSRAQAPKRTPAPVPPSNGQSVAKNGLQETVGALTLDGLRETIKKSGRDDTYVAWCLLSVGVDTPENPSREDLKAAMATMTVDQALRFDAILTDDDVPGSGGTE